MTMVRMIYRASMDEQFQDACQRYAHGNGSSQAIAAAALRATGAPELLEALQALLPDAEDAEVLNKQQGFHDIAAQRRGRINAARAAIAKAKGEQA